VRFRHIGEITEISLRVEFSEPSYSLSGHDSAMSIRPPFAIILHYPRDVIARMQALCHAAGYKRAALLTDQLTVRGLARVCRRWHLFSGERRKVSKERRTEYLLKSILPFKFHISPKTR
jgi:hypothetical protein